MFGKNATTIFLHIIQRFLSCINQHDGFRASLKFSVLILVLILLPNRELDFLFGLNPQLVWLVVVFIAGLSFLGYILAKFINPATAIGITGVIGGFVSPNLAIMSLAEQTRRYPGSALIYALAAAIVSTILFPRTLIVVWITSPPLALSLLPSFIGMTFVGITMSVLLWLRIRTQSHPIIELRTPYQIQTALMFGAIIAVILIFINVFELTIPETLTQSGIVLAALTDSIINLLISSVARARKMAWVIAIILFFSAFIGIGFVLLT